MCLLLSVTELAGGSGISNPAYIPEGNPYYAYLHNKKVFWWTRTRATDNGNAVWNIINTSQFGGNNYNFNQSNDLAPVIRLG